MIYIVFGFFNAVIGFCACKMLHRIKDEHTLRLIKIDAFKLGRGHGIRLATNMAKQAMGELKEYVTVKKPYYLPEHDGDVVTISFIINRR